jgi:predicted permease
MRSLRALLLRLAGLFGGRRRDRELADELNAHLQAHVDDNLRAGMTPEQARRDALMTLGGAELTKETFRDRRGLPLVETMLQDLRYAVRLTGKSPGFTLVAVLVLALGIGANSAIFSLVNALLLRPLGGVSQGGEIVTLHSKDRTRPGAFRSFSFPNYQDVRERNDLFSSLMAQAMAQVGLTEGDITRQVVAALVSANYFSTLDVPLAAGRTFTADEEKPGSRTPVVVVSHALWQKTGRDPKLVGSTLRINGRRYTVIGITPEGFTGTIAVVSPEIWLPTGVYGDLPGDMTSSGSKARPSDRSSHALMLVGRLKPGLTLKTAAPIVQRLSDQMEAAYPAENRNQTLFLDRVSRLSIGPRPNNNGQIAVIGLLLMCMAGLVLLVACLNLANMLLARGATRQREIAIRMALGGGRMRIVRQLLTEGLMLAIGGGAAGLLLAFWGTKALVSSFTQILPLVIVFDSRPDFRVLAATLGFSVAGTIAFSLGPAWKLSKADVASELKATGSESTGGARKRWFTVPKLLMVGQLAVSLALLAAAGLFIAGASKAGATDPGFNPSQRLVANIDPSMVGYDESRSRALYSTLLERLRALPGVDTVSVASQLPFGGSVETRFVEKSGAEAVQATYTIVGADYFTSLGLTVLGGREFTSFEERAATGPRVAIIDEPLARRLFSNENPIGRPIQFRVPQSRDVPESLEVVGVVPGLRHELADRAPGPHVFVPFGQQYRGNMTVQVKMATGGPEAEAAMLGTLRREIRAMDEGLPVLSVQTMRGYFDANPNLWLTRAGAGVFSAFGALALLLATVGVYGVRAYLVSQRTREIGIRMALGATAGSIVGLILRESVLLTLAGLGAGLVLAAVVSRLLSNLLYEVSPFDPRIFSAASLLLVAAALLASYLPARRAMRVDPLIALRQE